MTDAAARPDPPAANAADEHGGERLFSRDFVCATLANFINACGQQMLNSALPLYVVQVGGSNAEAGFISGLASVVALLFRPLIGWITDVWRRRPLVLVGTSCYALANVIYALSTSIGGLIPGRALHGFGLSSYSTAANSYVADIAPPKRRAEAIGLFAATNSLGLIIAPAIGFYIIARLGFHRLFNIATALALIATVVSLWARERRGPEVRRRPAWSWRTGIVAVDALPISWTALCLGMSYGSVTAFIAIFASSRGVANPGLYFTVQAIALLVSRTFSGRLADKRGRKFAIVPGACIMAAALALIPLEQGLPAFLVSGALMGLGFGMAQPATMALLVDQVGGDRRGLGVATYFIGFDGGVFVGSYLFGVVSQTWGFDAMWRVSAVCVLLGLVPIVTGRNVGARSQP